MARSNRRDANTRPNKSGRAKRRKPPDRRPNWIEFAYRFATLATAIVKLGCIGEPRIDPPALDPPEIHHDEIA